MSKLGCDYAGSDFGASYPDSTCIEGYLWDLDSCEVPGGPLSHGGDLPCPQCNHEEYLRDCCEHASEAGYLARLDGAARTFRLTRKELRYPEDFEALEQAWLAGFDEAEKEAKRF